MMKEITKIIIIKIYQQWQLKNNKLNKILE